MPFALSIKNLLALRSFRLAPPQGLSCLTGPNGSGKTTFLLALQMLSLALERGDLGAALSSTLGLFRLRNARAPADEPIELSLTVGDVCWTVQIIEHAGTIEPLAPESVTVGGQVLLQRSIGARAVWHRGSQLPPAADNRLALRYALDMRVDDEHLNAIQTWFDGMSVLYDLDLSSLRLNGSRAGVDRHLHSRGLNVFSLLRRWSERREDRFRFDFVRNGLRAAFPDVCVDLDFESTSQSVMLRTYRPYEELPLPASHEANGLLAMTIYLCALAGAPSGGVIVIDEPETALHPHAIHEFVDLARDLSRTRQLTILLLTHSPVFLDRFHEDRERVLLMEPGEQTQPISLAEHPNREWMAHFSPGRLYGHEEVAAPLPPPRG